MSWYEVLKDALGWIYSQREARITEQEAQILYYLLKYHGNVEQTAAELGAPQAKVLECRGELKAGGYLRTMISIPRSGWRRTPAGDDLFRALEAGRRDNSSV